MMLSRTLRSVFSSTNKIHFNYHSSVGRNTLLGVRNFATENSDDTASAKDKDKKDKDKKDKDSKKGGEGEQDGEDSANSNLPPFLKKASTTVMLTTLAVVSTSYFIYNFKKDISEEQKSQLSDLSFKFLENVAQPFRERFDNVFNNLLKEHKAFETVFGPAPLQKLLGPPLPGGLGRQYTLVIDLDSIISIARLQNHPAIYKRAALDYFLSNLSKHYEIVLYINNMPTSNPELITFKIDPQGNYLSSQLFMDSGLKEHNQFSHRVEMLNRDPKKVIFLDTQKYEHPNVINIGKFNPNTKESLLIDLLPVLLDIAKTKTDDVTSNIKHLKENDAYQSLSEAIQVYLSQKNIASPYSKKK